MRDKETVTAREDQPQKLPIDRPCSACSAGDYEMEYHDHHPPFSKREDQPRPTPLVCPACVDGWPLRERLGKLVHIVDDSEHPRAVTCLKQAGEAQGEAPPRCDFPDCTSDADPTCRTLDQSKHFCKHHFHQIAKIQRGAHPSQDARERAEFEKWAQGKQLTTMPNGDIYAYVQTEIAWQAWQAGARSTPSLPVHDAKDKWPPPGRSECANCRALIATADSTDGLEMGSTGILPCGCVYCWHCDDNRGRAEDHDPNCKGPGGTPETVAYWQHRTLEAEAKLKEYKEAAYRLENTIRLLRTESGEIKEHCISEHDCTFCGGSTPSPDPPPATDLIGITRSALDQLCNEKTALEAEIERLREALRDWQRQLLDAWANDHRATMTALLENGPEALRGDLGRKEEL